MRSSLFGCNRPSLFHETCEETNWSLCEEYSEGIQRLSDEEGKEEHEARVPNIITLGCLYVFYAKSGQKRSKDLDASQDEPLPLSGFEFCFLQEFFPLRKLVLAQGILIWNQPGWEFTDVANIFVKSGKGGVQCAGSPIMKQSMWLV